MQKLSLNVCSSDTVPLGCRAGETPWKTHILLNLTLVTGSHSSEFMMAMEVSAEDEH